MSLITKIESWWNNLKPADVFEKAVSLVKSRRRAYLKSFDGVDGQIVLKDLAKFCRANESTFHTDHAISDGLSGRREVWLRIQQHLNLTDEQLFDLLSRKD